MAASVAIEFDDGSKVIERKIGEPDLFTSVWAFCQKPVVVNLTVLKVFSRGRMMSLIVFMIQMVWRLLYRLESIVVWAFNYQTSFCQTPLVFCMR